MTWTQIAWAFFGLQAASCLLVLAIGMKISANRKRKEGSACN